jgi:hypothetical protein
MPLVLPRRKFLASLIGLVAAPMVVKASSLMPVKKFIEPRLVRRLVRQPFEFIVEGFDQLGNPVREVVSHETNELFSNLWNVSGVLQSDERQPRIQLTPPPSPEATGEEEYSNWFTWKFTPKGLVCTGEIVEVLRSGLAS